MSYAHYDATAGGQQDGESWEGEFDAAARQARLIRQRNLGRGWRPGGWQDPGELVRQLDGRLFDPAHRAAIARAELRQRLADEEIADNLKWLAEHKPENGGAR